MSLIKLPVSIGEAIDKLTILDIKYEMIKDARRDDCKKEYDMLLTELGSFLKDNSYYYEILKYINLKIWKDQDIIRDLKDDAKIGKLSIQILKDNDARFRIKKIINDKLNSELKEQKGYNKTIAAFIGHMGMGDFFNLNGAIRYISILYDEVILFCPLQYADNKFPTGPGGTFPDVNPSVDESSDSSLNILYATLINLARSDGGVVFKVKDSTTSPKLIRFN